MSIITSILHIGAARAPFRSATAVVRGAGILADTASVFGFKRSRRERPAREGQVFATANVMKTNNRSQKSEVGSQKSEAGRLVGTARCAVRKMMTGRHSAPSLRFAVLCVLCASVVNFAATAQVTTNRIQFRRGLDTDRSTNVFAVGEPAWSTNTHKLWLGDGATPGGLGVAMDRDLAAATNAAWNATTNWIAGRLYVTASITNGLASTGFVTGQGYVTASVTNGLASLGYVGAATNAAWNATTNWIAGQPYATASITNNLASLGYVDAATNAVLLSANGFAISQQQNLSDSILNVINSSGWLTAGSNVAFQGVDNQFAVNQSALSFTVANVYKSTNYVYIIPNGVTNIVDSGSTNYTAFTGASTFSSATTSLIGESTAYGAELANGMLVYDGQPGTCVGMVASIQDDATATLYGNAPYDAPGYVTVYRADTIFSTVVYDLTNIVAGLQTNLSFYAFNDGSRQTTAFSNSAAQINGIFGGPLALQSYADTAMVTQQQNLSNSMLNLIHSSGWLTAGSNVAFRGVDNQFAVNQGAPGFTVTNLYKPTNYVYIIPNGVTNIVAGTNFVQLTGLSTWQTSWATVDGQGAAYSTELSSGDQVYGANDGTLFIGTVSSTMGDVDFTLTGTPSFTNPSYPAYDPIWRGDVFYATNVYDLTNIIAGVQTNIGFYAFGDGSRQATAFSNSAAQINSIFGGPLALQSDVAWLPLTNSWSVFYAPSGSLTTNILGQLFDVTGRLNIGNEIDSGSSLYGGGATVLTNDGWGGYSWPIFPTGSNIVLRSDTDHAVMDLHTLVASDAQTITLGEPVQALAWGIDTVSVYYAQIFTNLASNLAPNPVVLDFATNQYQEIWLATDTSFITSNRVAVAKRLTLLIHGDVTGSTNYSLFFPPWQYVGGINTNGLMIPANGTVILRLLTTSDTTEGGVVADYR